MKHWRPEENWRNNYNVLYESAKDTQPDLAVQAGMQGIAFEAGADAMYEPAYQKGRREEREVLRKNPITNLKVHFLGDKEPRDLCFTDGKLVFIPNAPPPEIKHGYNLTCRKCGLPYMTREAFPRLQVCQNCQRAETKTESNTNPALTFTSTAPCTRLTHLQLNENIPTGTVTESGYFCLNEFKQISYGEPQLC